MSGYTIRSAVNADAAELARLSSQLGYPASEATIRARLTRIVDSPVDCLLVAASSDEKLDGWIQGSLCQLLESDYRVEIGGLLVDEGSRRKGVGAELVCRLEEWALSQGAVEVSVRCREERVEAHHFYESLRFKRIKRQQVFRKRLGSDEVEV